MKQQIKTNNVGQNIRNSLHNEVRTIEDFLNSVDVHLTHNNVNNGINAKTFIEQNCNYRCNGIVIVHDMINKTARYLRNNHTDDELIEIYHNYEFQHPFLKKMLDQRLMGSNTSFTPACDKSGMYYRINIINMILIDMLEVDADYDMNNNIEYLNFSSQQYLFDFTDSGLLDERYYYRMFLKPIKACDSRIIDKSAQTQDVFCFMKKDPRILISDYIRHSMTDNDKIYQLRNDILPLCYYDQYITIANAINEITDHKQFKKRYNNFYKAGIFDKESSLEELKLKNCDLNTDLNTIFNNQNELKQNDEKIDTLLRNLNTMSFFEMFLGCNGSNYKELKQVIEYASKPPYVKYSLIYQHIYHGLTWNKQDKSYFPFKQPELIESERENKQLKNQVGINNKQKSINNIL